MIVVGGTAPGLVVRYVMFLRFRNLADLSKYIVYLKQDGLQQSATSLLSESLHQPQRVSFGRHCSTQALVPPPGDHACTGSVHIARVARAV